MKTFRIVLVALLLSASLNVAAQTAKIKSIVIEAEYPFAHRAAIGGVNIAGTVGGEFNPGWDRCRPCAVNTQIPLSVSRTMENGSPIFITGGNMVIDGVQYNGVYGWLEMTYSVPNADLLLAYNSRKVLRFSRRGDADLRIKLWRNINEHPNGTPIFEQTMQMSCDSFLSVARYRNPNNTAYRHDTKSYQWSCALVE